MGAQAAGGGRQAARGRGVGRRQASRSERQAEKNLARRGDRCWHTPARAIEIPVGDRGGTRTHAHPGATGRGELVPFPGQESAADAGAGVR